MIFFLSHDNCSVEWCFKTRASEEGKTYNETDDEFRHKKKSQSAIQSPEKDYFPVSKRQSFKIITEYVWHTKKQNNEQCDSICFTKKDCA